MSFMYRGLDTAAALMLRGAGVKDTPRSKVKKTTDDSKD
jgi:hypothetical protein